MIFVAMLALSAMPMVVPTAQAATIDTPTMDIVVVVPGGVIKLAPGGTVPAMKTGSTLAVFLNATLTTGGAPDLCSDAKMTAKADLSGLGLTTTETVDPNGGTTAGPGAYTFKKVFTVLPTTPGSAAHASVIAGRLTVTPVNTPCTAPSPADVTAASPIWVDNSAPAGTLTVNIGSGTGVAHTTAILGDSLILNFTGTTPSEISAATVDLRMIGGSATQSIAPTGTGSNSFLLATDTTSAQPLVATLSDDAWTNATPASNPRTFSNEVTPAQFPAVDAHRPAAVSLAASPIGNVGTGFTLTWNQVADADVHDTGYRVVLKDKDASPQTTTTNAPGAAASSCPVSIVSQPTASTRQVTICGASLVSGHHYDASVFATDDNGNVGPVSATAPFLNVLYALAFNATTTPTTAWPTIKGTWTAPQAPSGGAIGTVGLWLRAESVGDPTNKDGRYWTGGPGDQSASFASTSVKSYLPFSIQNLSSSDFRGWFENDTLTPHASINILNNVGFNASALPSGSYTLGVDFNNTGLSPAPTASLAFVLDKSAPLVNNVGFANKIIEGSTTYYNATSRASAALADPIVVNGNFTDTVSGVGTGVASYTFALVSSATGNAPALDNTGAAVTGTCTNATVPNAVFAPVWTGSGAIAAGGCLPAIWANGPCTGGVSGTDCIRIPTTGVNVTLNYPTVAPGSYQVQIKATDRAGNVQTTLATPAITLLPHVSLAENDTLRAPFMNLSDATNPRLYAYAYAGADVAASTEWTGLCTTTLTPRVCEVAAVSIQGVNEADLANPAKYRYLDALGIPHGAATTLEGHELADGNPVRPIVPADPRGYYNYSHDYQTDKNGLSIQGLDSAHLFVRALANYTFPSPTASNPSATTTISVPTNWVRVAAQRLGTTTVTRPLDDSTVFLGGAQYTVTFNATFTQAGHTKIPGLNYTIRPWTAPVAPSTEPTLGAPISFNTTASDGVHAQAVAAAPDGTAAPQGPLYRYYFNNSVAIPRGEYVLDLTVCDNDVSPTFPCPVAATLGHASRFFAVETAASPTLTIDDARSEIFGGQYVGPTFNVTFVVNHGFANFSAATNLTPTLITNSRLYIANGTEDFFVFLKGDPQVDAAGTSTTVNYTVHMPGASGSNAYSLSLNASVDSRSLPGFSNSTTTLRNILVDTTPPTLSILSALSNETGLSLATAPYLRGTVTDPGSGIVKEVQVNVYNATSQQTFVPSPEGGGWVNGQIEAWLSSVPTNQSNPANANGDYNFTQDVVPPPATGGDWFVLAGPRAAYKTATIADANKNGTKTYQGLAFDRNATYVVTARARDATMGPQSFSGNVTATIAFDRSAPNFTAQLGGLAGASPTIQWHDADPANGADPSRVLSVGVEDNNCVASVSLTGTTPGGAAVPVTAFLPPFSSGAGTLNLTRGSDIVVGRSTTFTTDVFVGDLVSIRDLDTPSDLRVAKVAEVQDNAHLRLVAGWPGGTRVGTQYNLSSYRCNAPLALGAGPNAWTLPLADHPEVLDEVGTYRYKVDVADAAGNHNVSAYSYNVTVLDNQPPIIREVSLSPPEVGAGGRSTFRANVFENSKIDRVDAILTEIIDSIVQCDEQLSESRGCIIAKGPMRPVSGQVAANGTGNYFAESDNDLIITNPASLKGQHVTNLHVGSYLWTVRAQDTNPIVTCNPGCPQMPITLKVSTAAPTFLQQDAPAPNSTFANASPTFKWSVLGSRVAAADIHVDAGNTSATLVEITGANLTKTALPPVGNVSTGFAVVFAPGTLNVSAYSVQIRVSTPTGAALSSLANYTIDAIAPTVAKNVTGAVNLSGADWAVPSTRVNLTASDAQTSVASLTYSVNGGAETPYAGNVTPTGEKGDWNLTYTAKDAAGNAATGTVTLKLDRAAPLISVAQDGDTIVLNVNDVKDGVPGVGVDDANVTVFYAYGATAGFTPQKLTKVTANTYRAQLSGDANATGLKYYFEARDLLGNVQTTATGSNGAHIDATHPFVFDSANHVTPNQPPKIAITFPKEADEVRGKINATWVASDPEGARVGITITLRDPQGTGSVLAKDVENAGAAPVDLTGLAAGSYTLVVTASDGVASDNAIVNFTVVVGKVIEVHEPPASSVVANKQVRFTVAINPIQKKVATASFTVTRDGQQVQSGIMVPASGLYVGTYVPTAAGQYAISVAATYTDGTSEPATPVAAFSVTAPAPGPATGVGGFPTSLIALLAISALTIALVAYGVFVRWSK